MSLFQYKVINSEGKEVSGTLDAPSDAAARSALESMNFEILEVHEASRNKANSPTATVQPQAMKSFAFEGRDTSGTIRRGTIQSEDKYDAFSKLSQSQNLTLTMLSLVGVTPQFRDTDLENWQRKSQQKVEAKLAGAEKKTISFSTDNNVIQKNTLRDTKPQQPMIPVQTSRYAPLTDTLRLYSGWLLAWYSLFVALGYYVNQRNLPYDIPFVQAFFISPLIFSFTVAIFLFLLTTTIIRIFKANIVTSIVIAMLAISAFVVTRISFSY